MRITFKRVCAKKPRSLSPNSVEVSTIYEKDGQYCVKVEIEYSGNTPHFGGPAWVRRGSSTVEASEEVFQRLIELRLDLVRELSEWINKAVTVHGDSSSVPPDRESNRFGMGQFFSHRWGWKDEAKLIFVNRFWVTLEDSEAKKKSEPLEKLALSYDDEAQRLKIIASY